MTETVTKRKHVLITGGAGFIGSHLADRLLADGHRVTVMDNLLTGRVKNLPQHDNSQFIYWNIADTMTPYRIGTLDPDVVIHCAASYNDSANWERDAETNVIGTINVIRGIQKQKKPARIIYFQTSLCYGWPREKPIRLSHIIAPMNSYAVTKTAGEQFIRNSGLDYVSFRLANVYGPRNMSGPVPAFWRNFRNGTSSTVMLDTTRDFVNIETIVPVVMKAVHGNQYGVFHISSERETSIKELWETMLNIMLPALPLRVPGPAYAARGADDVPSILLSKAETEATFGDLKDVPLREGLETAIAWYNTSIKPDEPVHTHLKIQEQAR